MSDIMKTATSFSERGIPCGIGENRDKHEALERAGLNYTVNSVPLSELSDAKYANKFFAAVRSTDGAMLGVNSSRFHHFQPSLLGDFAEAIIKIRPDAHINLGGQSLDERTQFLGVCLDDAPVRAAGGDGRYRHILMYNGTNGNRVFGGHAVTQEMRCMNMFRALLKGGSQLFSLGHNFSSRLLVPTAMEAVQNAVKLYDEMDIEIERLLSIKIDSPVQLLGAIAGVRPDEPGRGLTEWEKRFDALCAEYKADYNTNLRGTAWGIVMASEGADEHRSRVVRGNRDIQRVNRMLTGNYPLTTRALALV
jgi:hypothetical protein